MKIDVKKILSSTNSFGETELLQTIKKRDFDEAERILQTLSQVSIEERQTFLEKKSKSGMTAFVASSHFNILLSFKIFLLSNPPSFSFGINFIFIFTDLKRTI